MNSLISLVRDEGRSLSLSDLLTRPVTILQGVSEDAAFALKAIGVFKVISFHIVPLDPAYKAGLAGHVPVKTVFRFPVSEFENCRHLYSGYLTPHCRSINQIKHLLLQTKTLNCPVLGHRPETKSFFRRRRSEWQV